MMTMADTHLTDENKDDNGNNSHYEALQAQETEYFADYDQSMYQAYWIDDQVLSQYVDNGNHTYDENDMGWEEQDRDDDDMYYSDEEEEEEDGDYHDDSALLRLILGVQSYLGETTTVNDDTPLMHLQYKMYTYMKQRAFELGMDTSTLM